MTQDDRIQLEIAIGSPLDEVWRALREPAEIRRWFGWDYDALAEEIEQIFVSGAEIDEQAHGLDLGDDRIALMPNGDRGTVLRISRPAPAGSRGWDDDYDEIGQGWLSFFQQLRFALERHPGRERRTLRLQGGSVGAEPPAQALGLAELAASGAPSTGYVTDAAPGERLVGELWFRARHQLGLTAGAYGDGLLILTSKPVGGAAATITTYGLDDATFGRVEVAWRAWWGERYPADED